VEALAITGLILGGGGWGARDGGVARFVPAGVATDRIAVRAALAAALGVVAWGLLVNATHKWSAFPPGVVVVLLAAGLLLVFLLGRELVARTRKTEEVLRRRR